MNRATSLHRPRLAFQMSVAILNGGGIHADNQTTGWDVFLLGERIGFLGDVFPAAQVEIADTEIATPGDL